MTSASAVVVFDDDIAMSSAENSALSTTAVG